MPQLPIIPKQNKTNNNSEPNTTKTITNQTQQKTYKDPKLKYKYVGKHETIWETISQVLPPAFIPTKKTGSILGVIFISVIILSLINIPFKSMIAGNVDTAIEVGLPYSFLTFSLTDPSSNPANFVNFFLDTIIYIIIAYILDVVINLIIGLKILKDPNELKKYPKVFQIKESAKINRFTQKAAEKTTEKIENIKEKLDKKKLKEYDIPGQKDTQTTSKINN